MQGMIDRGHLAISNMKQIGTDLRKDELARSKTKIGGGAAQITGGLLFGLGLGKYMYTGWVIYTKIRNFKYTQINWEIALMKLWYGDYLDI